MKKYHLWLLLIILISAGALKIFWRQSSKATAMIGDQKISVELRRTPLEWEKGLSGRKPLAENTGMLFVFSDTAIRQFWMKDMRFSIDIFWIRNGKVVGIAKEVPIPRDDIIPQVKSPEPVNYVLETNAGFAEKYGIKLDASFAFGRGWSY